ncbi:hypothetical protein KL86DES1_21378 [uncultured Desulfovibrio sp.]|uniref:Uncharacterized protein n=1 Tax=uncultured Desulfovibrio sp. TaxID=167968 RepID=A0A212L7L3_9BACT|nr:hypothetical protein KL86DES1_21378 [uncultured Desulfovibrio sp.]VZH34276.1 conserved protein of unknown function [Desulfovibrio sp. 86]
MSAVQGITVVGLCCTGNERLMRQEFQGVACGGGSLLQKGLPHRAFQR